MSRSSIALISLFLLLIALTLTSAHDTTTPTPRAASNDAGAAASAFAVFFQIVLWCCLTSLFFLPCLIFLCILVTFCVVASIEVVVYIVVYAKSAAKNGGIGSKKNTDTVDPIFTASPFVFAILEFFLPGCGYFALGQLQKGVIALGITVIIICVMLVCCYVPEAGYIINIILLVVLVILDLIGVVDVYGLACKCIQDGQPITAGEAYVSFLGTTQSSGNSSNFGGRGGAQNFSPYGQSSAGGYASNTVNVSSGQYPPQYPQQYPQQYSQEYPQQYPQQYLQAYSQVYPQANSQEYVQPNLAFMQNFQQQSTAAESEHAKPSI